jgi:hypothetical protein
MEKLGDFPRLVPLQPTVLTRSFQTTPTVYPHIYSGNHGRFSVHQPKVAWQKSRGIPTSMKEVNRSVLWEQGCQLHTRLMPADLKVAITILIVHPGSE